MTTRITGMYSGLDTESLIQQLTSSYQSKRDKVYKEQQTVKIKQDVWKDVNKDINTYFSKLSKFRLSSSYKNNEISNSNSKVADISGDNITGTQSVEVKQVATNTFVTGATINNSLIGQKGIIKVRTSKGETSVNITEDMTMQDLATKLSESGINANFDSKTKRLFLSSKDTGLDSNFEIEGDNTLLNSVGLGIAAVKKEGQNAIINLNGADFEQSSNIFNINNMTITANEVGKTTIRNQENDNVYNKVKEFITSYNEIIKKLDTLYNDDSAKGYKPLTDDEKDALSDRQVSDWEDKLKAGALYKDTSLNDVRGILKNALSSVSVDGISLYSIGIKQGNYLNTEKNERNVYNIDEDALKKAISEDPDKVIKLITTASQTMYDKLNDKMKSSSLNSVYNVYNDKQLKKEYENYEKKLSEWQTKIQQMEDKYYAQFAKMETLLSKTQNQTDWISSFFG